MDPWRFDVARNISLENIPEDADVCIALDLDEQLAPNWRTALDAAWKPGTTRLKYLDVRKWQDEGRTPKEIMFSSKIHSRHGYYWKFALHESLLPKQAEVQAFSQDLRILHFQDRTKRRDSYWHLIQKLVKEEAGEPHYWFYFGQELFMLEKYTEALSAFEKFLSFQENPSKFHRAMVFRLMAASKKMLKFPVDEVFRHLLQAAAESPKERENWANLAILMAEFGNWPNCLAYVTNALKIQDPTQSFFVDVAVWDGTLEKLLAECCAHLQIPQKSEPFYKGSLSNFYQMNPTF